MNKQLENYLNENNYEISISMLIEFIESTYYDEFHNLVRTLENNNDKRIEMLVLKKLESRIEDDVILSLVTNLLKTY